MTAETNAAALAEDEAAHLIRWFDESDGFAQGTKAPHKWVLQAASLLRDAALLRAGAAKVPEEMRRLAEVALSECPDHGVLTDWQEAAIKVCRLLATQPTPVVESDEPHPPTRDCPCAACRPSFDDDAPPAPDAGVVEQSRPPLPFLPATLTVEQIRSAVQAVSGDQKGTQ